MPVAPGPDGRYVGGFGWVLGPARNQRRTDDKSCRPDQPACERVLAMGCIVLAARGARLPDCASVVGRWLRGGSAAALLLVASGFASFLPVEQLLVLWDRILGFDSLELLPILAAAVFVYRAKWLLQASEPSHVQRLLADATGLKVVPLLQLFLADCNQLVYLGDSGM